MENLNIMVHHPVEVRYDQQSKTMSLIGVDTVSQRRVEVILDPSATWFLHHTFRITGQMLGPLGEEPGPQAVQ